MGLILWGIQILVVKKIVGKEVKTYYCVLETTLGYLQPYYGMQAVH